MVKDKCICPNCPSFIKCKEELYYCLKAKSKCIKSEAGCICPSCPVQIKKGFVKVYYCTRGKA